MLLKTFFGKFDLCAEFKRLYVYDHVPKRASLTEKEKRHLSVWIRRVSSPPEPWMGPLVQSEADMHAKGNANNPRPNEASVVDDEKTFDHDLMQAICRLHACQLSKYSQEVKMIYSSENEVKMYT